MTIDLDQLDEHIARDHMIGASIARHLVSEVRTLRERAERAERERDEARANAQILGRLVEQHSHDAEELRSALVRSESDRMFERDAAIQRARVPVEVREAIDCACDEAETGRNVHPDWRRKMTIARAWLASLAAGKEPDHG